MSKFAAVLMGSAILMSAAMAPAQAMPIQSGLDNPVQVTTIAYGCPPGLVPGPYGCRVYHPWLHGDGGWGRGYGSGYRVYHPWLHGNYGGGYRPYHPWLHRWG